MKTYEEARIDLLSAVADQKINPSATTDSLLDKAALDAIQATMSGEDWSPDTLDAIADIVRLSGRTIDDTPEEDPA